jgi:hypothetical protein
MRLGEYVAISLIVAIVAGIIVAKVTHGTPQKSHAAHKAPVDMRRTIVLARGGPAAVGYYYAVALVGFPALTRVSVSCRDSQSPAGFYTFGIRTDSAGNALTSSECYDATGIAHWVVVDRQASAQVRWGGSPSLSYVEVAGAPIHTWSIAQTASGTEGPTIPSKAFVTVTCVAEGFRVADGNAWWYRVGSAPWSNQYYASADGFYNNNTSSGSLRGTPFVDPRVPRC